MKKQMFVMVVLVLLAMGLLASVNGIYADEGHDCEALRNSVLPEPPWYAEQCLKDSAASPRPANPLHSSRLLAPTDIGWAHDIGFISNNFFSFPLNNFPAQTVTGQSTDPIFGYDFDSTATTLYGLNDGTQQLGTSDFAGVFNAIGASIPQAGQTWTGLAIDPVNDTIYASSADGVTSCLYTLNPATGAATVIGCQTVATGIIAIAMNCEGQMYAHDILTNSIYQLNPADGSATLVGATGYNANFAQGMDFDNDDGTLYVFLYQGGGANVYGTVDLNTGAVTPLFQNNPLGEFEAATQTRCPPPHGAPAGGVMVPVNKLGLLALRLRSGQAPRMGLAALASLAALTVALVRRRRA